MWPATRRSTASTRRQGGARRHLARPLREQREGQARPGGRGHRHHPHADGAALRGDHGQRRPDERGRSTSRAARVRDAAWCASSPVFEKGAGATENSLIGTGPSLIVENNHGYEGPPSRAVPSPPRQASSGWTSSETAAAASRSGRARSAHRPWCRSCRWPAGSAYFYTKPPGLPERWYLTAVSFKTGRTVWRGWWARGRLQQQLRRRLPSARTGSVYWACSAARCRLADG